MVKLIRHFCWHQTFDPKDMSAPMTGQYTCGKTLKNMNKIRVQRNVFETYTKWAKLQGLSVDIKILSPRGCLPLPRGYIHVEKQKICIKSELKEILF